MSIPSQTVQTDGEPIDVSRLGIYFQIFLGADPKRSPAIVRINNFVQFIKDAAGVTKRFRHDTGADLDVLVEADRVTFTFYDYSDEVVGVVQCDRDELLAVLEIVAPSSGRATPNRRPTGLQMPLDLT